MLKKVILIIIGFALLLLVSFGVYYEITTADTTPPYDATKDPKSPVSICQVTNLNTYFSITPGSEGDGYKNLEKALSKNDNDSVTLKIRIAFETARKMYQDTIKCVFDVATVQLLGSATGIGNSINKNNIPSIDQALPDLLRPDKMCRLADNTKFKDIVNSTGPGSMLSPLLSAYNSYSDFISKYLAPKLDNVPVAGGGDVTDILKNSQGIKLIFENEIQNSIMSLDAALQSLKEMRQSFVMHVKFECILQDLQSYQALLKNIRSMVSVLPSIITDCSMHK